jgi:transposase
MLSMSRTTTRIVLVPEERATLDAWARGRNLPYRKVVRSRIISMAADGVLNQDIANALSVSRPTVQLWRERFLALRLAGLEKDAPRPGRKPKVSVKKIRAVVEATLNTSPPNATHWSTRSMAKAQALSQATVYRIWKQHNLKPHLVKTFKLSRDKHFVEKLQDVVGLYLNPPDKALVLCVDEKSQIQALDRTQPGLPMKKGQTQWDNHVVCGA